MCVCVPVYISRSLGIEIFAHIVEPAGPSTRKSRTRTRTTTTRTTITMTRVSVAFTCLHVVIFFPCLSSHFFFDSFLTFRSFTSTNYFWKNTIFRDFSTFLRSWIFFQILFFPFFYLLLYVHILGNLISNFSQIVRISSPTIFFHYSNKMKRANPNAHTYVNGADVKTHGYAVTHNAFSAIVYIEQYLYMFPLLPVCSVEWKV